MVLREERIFYLDELRAVAILMVLLAHTIKYFPVNVDYLTSPTLLSYLSISRMKINPVSLFFMQEKKSSVKLNNYSHTCL